MEKAEKKHGKWVLEEDIQTESDFRKPSLTQVTKSGASEKTSDPICSSAGCTQYKFPKKKEDYPKDYPVPNFGVDEDVITT